MFSLEYSGQFKKDLKLAAKRGWDINAIRSVINILENDGQVPAEYHPHILKGNWNGTWECHIEPDWLLLYDITDSIKLIRLVRTGTHADLFKK